MPPKTKWTVRILLALAGAALGLYLWAPDEVVAKCDVNIAGAQCLFVHQGLIPGRACVVVHIYGPDNAQTWANQTCSGIMVGDTTTVVPVIGFGVNPAVVCAGGWNTCRMEIEQK